MRGGCERGGIFPRRFGPSSGRGPEGLRSRSHREGTGQVIPREEGRASAGGRDRCSKEVSNCACYTLALHVNSCRISGSYREQAARTDASVTIRPLIVTPAQRV